MQNSKIGNQIKKDIQTGLKIIRKEGINFTVFKKRVSDLLTNPKKISEDHWVMLYEFYAELKSHYHQTVEEWTKNHFQDFTNEEHEIQLI